MRGARRVISAAGTEGVGGIGIAGEPGNFSNAETMFGKATSPWSRTFGGATTVCEWLSGSRGSEMIGCAEYSGSALAARLALDRRVSSGGRYSAGV